MTTRTVPLLRPAATPAPSNPIPSSSPAFGTPIHPFKLHKATTEVPKRSILTILLPPATLRPLAFRTFTKKHNLTLTSSALQALATFIGKNCGSGWREEGLAERILEEIAKSWKKIGGGVIVEGDSDELRSILRNLEGYMSGGRVAQGKALSRHESFTFGDSGNAASERSQGLEREESQTSPGMSTLRVGDEEEDGHANDPRKWLQIVGAFEQPRLEYIIGKKHFEQSTAPPSLLPSALHKTQLFRHRYHLIHQRLLRNESFQTSSFAPARAPSLQRSSSTVASAQNSYKITSIANLLGRSGSSHLLLGLLTIAPAGTLSLSDLTGSIALDLQHAKPVPENGAWFAPGMIVLVEGIYEELGADVGAGLGGGGGVGGTIGGKFIGFSVGGPPCEQREVTLGVSDDNNEGNRSAGGGFGWVDFLGVGSERALGSRMRMMEQRVIGRGATAQSSKGRSRVVIMGEVNLDSTKTLEALKMVLGTYAAESVEDSPMTVFLIGNFVQHAVMAGGGSGGSIEYKEYFDSLASTLAEFPTILQNATFIFVPGDNDPWASSFSAGAATPLPRRGVPELFTSRIKRAFATANTEAEKELGRRAHGEAIWTTNPSRMSLFGPTQEIVLFRDDISGRLRRNAIRFKAPDPEESRATNDSAAVTSQNVSPEDAEQMDIDHAVEAAESHIPTTNTRAADLISNISPDLFSARKLVKTILDQGYLSPFPITTRPVLWDYANALQLYPLPTALVLVDPEAPPFAVTYEGCHVMNPGKLVAEGRRGMAQWMEYDARSRKGKVRQAHF
ncbi:MAG: DNA-directed DNA polymerase epsilon, subunit B [Pleopsidium flavum]|nr:MAG: DNA-directed DNA polymerase epsilon, subunit B [Pleopsidium flavum]